MTKAWFSGRLHCLTCRNPIVLNEQDKYIHIYATPEPHPAVPAGDAILDWNLPKSKGGGYKLPRPKKD